MNLFRLAAVILAALLAASCATVSTPDMLSKGGALLDDRKPVSALALFDAAAKLNPSDPDVDYMRAQALLALGRYGEAVSASEDALRKKPDFYEAIDLGWAARLEAAGGSSGVAAGVRAEVERLNGRGDHAPAGLLFAVYNGYVYLKDAPGRAQAVMRLAENAVGTRLAEEAAALLAEEMIAPDQSERAALLAESYVRNFPRGRMAEQAVIALLDKKAETVPPSGNGALVTECVTVPNGSSRRLNAGASWWLAERGHDPSLARYLAERAIELLDREGLAEKPLRFDEQDWRREMEQDRDRYNFYLGRACFKEGDAKCAKAALEPVAARRNWPGPNHVLAQLALHEGRTDIAVKRLKLAMEAGGARREAEELLRQLTRADGELRKQFLDYDSGVTFTDVTAAAGFSGVKASRAAWGDFDRDGFDDLLLDGRRLFRNRGDGTFVDVTEPLGFNAPADANGGVFGDYDNDGFPDILSTSRGGNRLFHNVGGRRFEDVTAKAFGVSPRMETEAAAWGDIDNDGWLDLYIANYERGGVTRGLCLKDRLYRNNGDGTFTDVSRKAGIVTEEPLCGRGVIWSDLNNDNRLDILVANYRLDPNLLWLNRGGGLFSDEAGAAGVRGVNKGGSFGHSIGAATGDINGDGLIDIYVSNLAHPRNIENSDKSMLLLNSGPPDYRFVGKFADSGIAFEETNADPALADVDNDGDLDLYVTSIYPGRNSHLYINDGKGKFSDRAWYSGTRVGNGWGAAFSDFDNDGQVDLIVASADGVRLFRNDGSGNRWLKVRVDDSRCNRAGIGAKVRASFGGRSILREIAAGRGTGSQDSAAVVIGLGQHDGPVELPVDLEVTTLCGDVIRRRIERLDDMVVIGNPGETK
ncbi:MAG: VCBS repeat-containing protein [Nitrospirae bacterium]|nr:VCBS repeat-containing protein [Nitrospirota bacterium]